MTRGKTLAALAVPAAIAEDSQRALYRKLEFFPTPPWAARAGAELLRELYPKAKTVWEPACGAGHIAEPLKEFFRHVWASDIYDHGYGEVCDFLAPGEHPPPMDWVIADLVVTNPPFQTAAEFVRRGREHAVMAVAVLCRIQFLESEERWKLHYVDANLAVVAPFAERVSMCLGAWDPHASNATQYAWFIYDLGPCKDHPKIIPIGPGTKTRLSKPDDVRRFARAKDLPLLEKRETRSEERGDLASRSSALAPPS